jgi:hypothetical protein
MTAGGELPLPAMVLLKELQRIISFAAGTDAI